MALFVLGDPHLSLGASKPMDIFPGWNDYVERLEKNWRKLIQPEDTIVLAGDISWAMRLTDTRRDFAFLQSLPGVTVVRCENTAVAAKRVAESDRTDVAALSSRACVGLYGLESLASSVQDQGNNYTRFICIAKDLEIYPGADRTSLMMVLPHKPGSLYKVLSRFYALGINLNKLESRPLPERDFEFMFYFDLETSVYSPQFQQLMGELPGLCEEFSYLGSYREVV